MRKALKNIFETTGYEFKNPELLKLSFTHRSFAHESQKPGVHNERLEFLGDSVLSTIISEITFKFYPEATEGELSKLRSSIINEEGFFKFGQY